MQAYQGPTQTHAAGGAGLCYGLSLATNHQIGGAGLERLGEAGDGIPKVSEQHCAALQFLLLQGSHNGWAGWGSFRRL